MRVAAPGSLAYAALGGLLALAPARAAAQRAPLDTVAVVAAVYHLLADDHRPRQVAVLDLADTPHARSALRFAKGRGTAALRARGVAVQARGVRALVDTLVVRVTSMTPDPDGSVRVRVQSGWIEDLGACVSESGNGETVRVTCAGGRCTAAQPRSVVHGDGACRPKTPSGPR